jgi:membrane protease YdiL (CAAX protease family)
MMLGILFGYLFFWSRSLWVPILAHFLHNGLQVVLVYLYQHKKIAVDIDKINSLPPYVTMIGTALLFVTLYIFDYTTQKQAPKDGEGLGENILNK